MSERRSKLEGGKGEVFRLQQIVRGFVGIGAGVLLISMGAQIFAAPVTVPALLWAIATARVRWARRYLSAVLALTLMFVGWYLAYIAVGERQPWIVLSPAVAFALGVAASLWLSHHFPRSSSGDQAA